MNKMIVIFLLLLTCSSMWGTSNLDVVDRFTDPKGLEIIGVRIPGGRPPEDYVRKEAIDINSLRTNRSIVIIDDVPAYDWSYGCSATSAAMIAAYYDRNGYPNMYTGGTNAGIMPLDNSVWNESAGGEGGDGECPLSATHQGIDGRSIRGHVDNYWIEYGSENPDPYITNGWTPHTNADCTGDFMGTNQSYWSNSDASTRFYTYDNGAPLYSFSACEDYSPPKKDGGYGFEQFMESRGYEVNVAYNQKIYGFEGNTLGFTFSQYMAEIDANRPVLIHVTGHTMVGFGYDSSNQTIYIKNTWDYSTHTMTWGGSYEGMQHYSVTVLHLQAGQEELLGDNFTNPISITSLPYSDSKNTNNFTNTVGNSSNDAFYQVSFTSNLNNVTISTNGSSYDTYLRVYDSSQNQIYYDDDGGEGTRAELTNINFLANTIYYICVEGYSSNNGQYMLNVFLQGDNFESAIPITSIPYNATGNTNYYSNTIGNNSNDVFYIFNNPNTYNNVTISLNNSDYDSYLRVYNADQTQILYNDDGGNGTNAQLTGISFEANTDYFICIEGYSSNNGNYVLNLTGDIYVATPKSVENIEIIYIEGMIMLAWDEVTLDVNDNPVTPDLYNVYVSATGNEGSYVFDGSTDENDYVVSPGDYAFNPVFFKVTAIKNEARDNSNLNTLIKSK